MEQIKPKTCWVGMPNGPDFGDHKSPVRPVIPYIDLRRVKKTTHDDETLLKVLKLLGEKTRTQKSLREEFKISENMMHKLVHMKTYRKDLRIQLSVPRRKTNNSESRLST